MELQLSSRASASREKSVAPVARATTRTGWGNALAEAASARWAGPVFWYNHRDFCHYAPDADSECFYGLKRFDGSRKPAFDKFRAAP